MIGALFAASIALGAGKNHANDEQQFVGVWRFISEVATKDDGTPAPPAAALGDSQGLLIYTADGFMAVNLMPTHRAWTTETASIEELRSTVDNGVAYSGRYTVDRAAHTVTHITLTSMDPAYQGKNLIRSYAFKNGDLELSGTFPWQGETSHFAIIWRKVAAASARAAPADARAFAFA